MRSIDPRRIVGYEHTDGYELCCKCAEEYRQVSEGPYLRPILDTDEWDYAPVCALCEAEIDVLLFTEWD